jgi:hypothetical protein
MSAEVLVVNYLSLVISGAANLRFGTSVTSLICKSNDNARGKDSEVEKVYAKLSPPNLTLPSLVT